MDDEATVSIDPPPDPDPADDVDSGLEDPPDDWIDWDIDTNDGAADADPAGDDGGGPDDHVDSADDAEEFAADTPPAPPDDLWDAVVDDEATYLWDDPLDNDLLSDGLSLDVPASWWPGDHGVVVVTGGPASDRAASVPGNRPVPRALPVDPHLGEINPVAAIRFEAIRESTDPWEFSNLEALVAEALWAYEFDYELADSRSDEAHGESAVDEFFTSYYFWLYYAE